MSKQPVYADGGEMTKQQMLAAYGWGPWGVQWPSQMPEDALKQIDPGDGNSWGFVYRIRKTPGRHGRRFARADMSIIAADFPENSSVPIPGSGFSDVEASLDELEQRTLGDVFFEKEVTRAGLGPLVPYRDFNVGDRWDLVIWGLRMAGLPVTSISEVTELGEVVGWRLIFGGQLVADNAANRRVQDELGRQIEAQKREQRQEAQRMAEENARKIQLERTEREKAMIEQKKWVEGDFRTGVLDSASSQSSAQITSALGPIKSDLSAVRSTASSAYSRASSANTRIDNLWLSGTGKELKDAKAQYDKDLKQIQTTLGGDRNFQNAFSNELWKLDEQARQMGVQSPEQLQGAFEKYRTINTALWQNQKVLDARQDAMIATTDRRVPLMFAFRSQMSTGLGDISLPDGNVSFQKKPGWSGYLAVICHVKAANSYSFSNAWEVGYWDTGPYSVTTRTFENVESGLLIIARK